MNEKIKRFIQLINESNLCDSVDIYGKVMNELKTLCNELDNLLDKATKYNQLSEDLECPVDVYIKLTQANRVTTDIPEYLLEEYENCSYPHKNIVQHIMSFGKKSFDVKFKIIDCDTGEVYCTDWKELYFKDYKKTWWLNEDMSE